MKMILNLLIGAIFMSAHFATASAPMPIEGPDSYSRYQGKVESAKITKQNIGTSGVSAETKDFLEVKVKITKAETIELPAIPEAPTKLTQSGGSSEGSKPHKIIPDDKSKGKTLRFFFPPNEKIKKGENLEIETRSRSSISYGWTSGEFGASYKKISKKK